MSRSVCSVRKIVGPIVGVLVCCVALSACGGSSGIFRPATGSNERSVAVDALNMAIVVDGQGHGRVVGALLNNTGETTRLVDASVDTEGQSVTVTMPGGPVKLPPGEVVQLAPRAAVSVEATTSQPLPAGYLVDLTLQVDGTAPMSLQIPVEPRTGPYSEIEVRRSPDGTIAPH